jgi:hypothetical protein
MIAEFRTGDGTKYQINTESERWTSNSGEGDDLKTDGGKLTQTGYGTFSLEPRTPKDGFCVLGLHCFIQGTTLHILAKGNQPIYDFTLPGGVDSVLYEIIP